MERPQEVNTNGVKKVPTVEYLRMQFDPLRRDYFLAPIEQNPNDLRLAPRERANWSGHKNRTIPKQG